MRRLRAGVTFNDVSVMIERGWVGGGNEEGWKCCNACNGGITKNEVVERREKHGSGKQFCTNETFVDGGICGTYVWVRGYADA